MLNWFIKKPEYPAYWQQYEAIFKVKPAEYVKDAHFVVLDTETTGFDYNIDRILCVGAVKVFANSIDLAETFEAFIKQERFNPSTVEIHGIIKNERFVTSTEEDAIAKFLTYIGNAVLVAHHASFDIGMINRALKRKGLPKLKNKVLDTVKLYRATRITSNLIDNNKNYTLDELAENLNIDLKDRHTAAGDAYITAIALIKILNKLDKKGNLRIKDLLKL